MTARYTVFGNPVAHSKSPPIHQHFAAQEGVSIEYTRTFAENTAEDFAAAVRAFFAGGGSGANVTLPFKQFAYELVDEHSERALAAGAVNTLIPLDNGRLRGDNTDGIGLVRDLTENLGLSLAGKNLLIVGAGGAARGVILPLLACRPASLTVCNRTAETARALAEQFGIRAIAFNQLNSAYDLIINATSGSLNDDVPPLPPAVFSGCLMAYDMFYADEATAFMRFAAAHGAERTADGLGMLVGQAADSYRIWRGFEPDIKPVIAALHHGSAA